MSIRFEDNYGNGTVEVEVTGELDQGAFVSLVATRADEDGNESTLVDLYLTDPYEIEAYFKMQDEAKANYYRLKAQSQG